jgi:cell division protein ZapA (FtsZ GTPase activity inhibitor)
MTQPPPTTQASTVTVGGHKYRVNSSANAEQLARLAELVDERLLALPLGQRGDPKSLVLIALGLAHDLEREQHLRAAERLQMDQRVRTLIDRVDHALGHVDLNGNPLPAVEVESSLDSAEAPAAGSEDAMPALQPTVTEHALVRAGISVTARRNRSPVTTKR